jgi:transcriptional regulator with XRE-family HTH domain
MTMYPNLKLQIFKSGIRQNQIAKDLKLRESQLSKIIHGYREPSADERKLLASYLNVDESWLFERYESVPLTQAAMFAMRGDRNGGG